MLKHLPNLITILNLLAGSVAVMLAFNEQIGLAGSLLLLAALFDFLDGFTARLLKAYSALGKQLDSLADLVSFGLAPAAIAYELLAFSMQAKKPGFGLASANWYEILFLCSPLLLVAFAAIRLARFNVSNDQQASFKGLPSPATGLFFASLAILYERGFPAFQMAIKPENLTGQPATAIIILGLVVIFSILMILPLDMISLKFKDFSFRNNRPRYILIIFSAVLLLIAGVAAIPLIILVYLGISLATRSNN